MRNVFLVGVAAAVVYWVVSRALLLLNQSSNLSVTAGYLLLVALVALAAGLISRGWRRL